MVAGTRQSAAKVRELTLKYLPLADVIADRLRRTYHWMEWQDLKSYAHHAIMLALQKYDPKRKKDSNIKSYIVWKSTYIAIDEMRKDLVVARANSTKAQKRPIPLIDEPLDDCDNYKHVDQADLLSNLLRRLKHTDQQLLMMYYTDNLTFKQIAKMRGVSESAVCLRHTWIIKKLRAIAKTIGV